MRRLQRRRGRFGADGLVSRFVRFTAALVLLAFGWRVSAAFIEPCIGAAEHADAIAAGAGNEAGHGESDGCCPKRAASPDELASSDGAPQGEGCSCPIHCGPCCDGAVMHALAAELPTVVLGLSDLVELPATRAPSARSNADPRGILHVPRTS